MSPENKTYFHPNPIALDQAAAGALPSLAQELTAAVNHNASKLGTPAWPDVPAAGTPIVGSGHQAWFWHPGILIKDFTAARVARENKGLAFHIVVDHDEHPACILKVPVKSHRLLTEKDLVLAWEKPALSSLDQPVIDLQKAIAAVDALVNDNPAVGATLARFRAALVTVDKISRAGAITPTNLAEQVTVILDQLRRALGIELPVLFASQLAEMSAFKSVVLQMLADPRACVDAYNAAVMCDPDAGIAPLSVSDNLVELPFWIMNTDKPGPRVKGFAKRASAAGINNWQMCTLAGEIFNPSTQKVFPRALTMTAVLRSHACHLFVHGKGGGRYDKITEHWWRGWLGKQLSAMAVASCDLYLPFDVPFATKKDLTRAIWEQHHFPHNADRYRPRGSSLVVRKGEILQRMNQTRDHAERARLFTELHETNDALVSESPDLTDAINRKLADARDGVLNANLLARRDWCFAFYEPGLLTQIMG